VGGALGMVGALAPVCATLPPAWLVFGAAVGLAATPSIGAPVPADDVRKLEAILRKEDTTDKLHGFVSKAVRGEGGDNEVPGLEDEAPRLYVRVIAIVLVPTAEGVSFRLVAEAIGDPGESWKPSYHTVFLPSRSADDWLGGEGYLVKRDIAAALRLIGRSISVAYKPYEAAEAAAAEKAVVHFYRPDTEYLRAVYPGVYVDEDYKFGLYAGYRGTFVLPSGEHQVVLRSHGMDSKWPVPEFRQTLHVKEGREYYIRVTPYAADRKRHRRQFDDSKTAADAIPVVQVALVTKAQASSEMAKTRSIVSGN
jgi:hypothetical protein